jgi:methionyl-tRNA synthetase
MYVWVDALTNYMTGCGYPRRCGAHGALLAGRHHAPDRQGHCPLSRRLLARLSDEREDLPLPKTVFGHGFLLNRGEKMSKSSRQCRGPDGPGRTGSAWTSSAISCCAK